MASIEVVGLVLGSFPLLLSAIKNYDSGAERFKGLPKPSTGLNDEGSWMTWFLYLFFNDSLDVMVKVEQYVLGADDAQVIAFLNSYTSSFNMIGVAVGLSDTLVTLIPKENRALLLLKSLSQQCHSRVWRTHIGRLKLSSSSAL